MLPVHTLRDAARDAREARLQYLSYLAYVNFVDSHCAESGYDLEAAMAVLDAVSLARESLLGD